MNYLPATSFPSLQGKRIVLGVTGGIAAYKSAELVRQLQKNGASVRVVMTEAACEFVQPLTFQALTGQEVSVSQWAQNGGERGMPHIDLGRWADVFLVAPCTANTMAKIALGQADNLLTNLILARNCPLAIAPAMNVEMWNNPATQRNLKVLEADGIAIFGPGIGEQACGEVGAGRMLEPHEIVLEMARLLTRQSLKGKSVLLTAGPTLEAIDPVRAITNHSSGKMGYSLALACWLQGAKVSVVAGPTSLAPLYGVSTRNIQSAREMYDAVTSHLDKNQVDLFCGVAAVADYGVSNPSSHKQKKSDSNVIGLNIEFYLNPDILATVGTHSKSTGNPAKVLGFAAETHDLEAYAQAKLVSKNADYIIGNLATQAMGADENKVSIYSASSPSPVHIAQTDKLTACLEILKHITI